MGFNLETGITTGAVFLQGLLSFFSPCVLPLLPVYFGYLSGGTAVRDGNGEMRYNRLRVALNTFCFVAGIAFAFLLLGLGMTALGSFFGRHQKLLTYIGGAVVILFGLYQLGVFGKWMTLERERRLPFRLDRAAASPWMALILGFLFSFAWTPCVGPSLTGVLLMAASAASRAKGLLLLGLYTLGFVLPFLAAGFFTASLLQLFRKHRNVVRYTAKIGGVVLILMGVLMLTGTVNRISGTLASVQPSAQTQAQQQKPEPGPEPDPEPEKQPEDPHAAIDFTLTDQFGRPHRLSDYRGRVVFLNFWATWCPPCREEMPYIQNLYEKYGDDGDVVILAVAGPGSIDDQDEAGVKAFLSDNGYTYPVLMDLTGEIFGRYSVNSLPTTFMIDRNGSVLGYVPGGMTQEMMQSIIDQTLALELKTN